RSRSSSPAAPSDRATAARRWTLVIRSFLAAARSCATLRNVTSSACERACVIRAFSNPGVRTGPRRGPSSRHPRRGRALTERVTPPPVRRFPNRALRGRKTAPGGCRVEVREVTKETGGDPRKPRMTTTYPPPARGSSPPPSRGRGLRRGRVLVVDDEPVIG